MLAFVARVTAEREWTQRPPPSLTMTSNFKSLIAERWAYGRMCIHKHCKFEKRCVHPHTDAELEEWQLRAARLQELGQWCVRLVLCLT